MGKGTELWTSLEPQRERFLTRARVASAVTVPYLLPPDGHMVGQDLPDLYTSIGSKGVNNLASKLMLTLFPPDAPYFQLEPEPEAASQIPEEERVALEAQLRKIEDVITRDLEVRGIRTAIYETLRHLLISGNAVLHVPDEGPPKVFGLDRFVVERDAKDNVTKLVIISTVPTDGLPDGVDQLEGTSFFGSTDKETTNVFTIIERGADDKYTLSQEIGEEGQSLTGTRKVSAARLPYKVIRLNKISGEPYGRGFVDEHIGDLKTLEGLTQALVEGVAISVDTRFLVDPQGMTDPTDLENTPNGGYAPGRKIDVDALQTNKALDLRVGRELADEIKRELKQSFLLLSGIQRNAERVTAAEHSSLARELESSLGGVHSNLTAELQLPLVELSMVRLTEEDVLPALEDDVVKPRVVTGVEALGRSQELARLQAASQLLQGMFGPQALAGLLNPNATAERIFSITGFNSEGLVKTQEQLAQEQQAAQQQALLERSAPQIVKEVGEATRDQPQ